MKENNLNMGEVTAATISPFLTALNAVVCINYDAHWSMLKLQYIWKKTKLHRPTGFDMHPYQGQETLSVTKDTGITVHIVIQLSKVDAHQRQRSQRRCPKYYKCLSKNQMTLEFDLSSNKVLCLWSREKERQPEPGHNEGPQMTGQHGFHAHTQLATR